MKDNDVDPTDSGSQNPYCILLHQLTGTSILKPRCKQVSFLWRKSHKETIKTEVRRPTHIKNIHPKKLAPVHEKVVKELFSALPKKEQLDWSHAAKEDHQELLEQWEREIKSSPSTVLKDCQRYVQPFLHLEVHALNRSLSCIQALTRFVLPILNLICNATGWKATLLAGGPEPAHSGHFKVCCFSSHARTSVI